MKAGDTIRVECSWDRSLMPNPEPRYVTWAEGTEDEMCYSAVTSRPSAKGAPPSSATHAEAVELNLFDEVAEALRSLAPPELDGLQHHAGPMASKSGSVLPAHRHTST